MNAPHWNAERLLALVARATDAIGGRQGEVCFRLTMSVFFDDAEVVPLARLSACAWERSFSVSNEAEASFAADELARELARAQQAHTAAVGGPGDSIEIFVAVEANRALVGLWSRSRPAREVSTLDH